MDGTAVNAGAGQATDPVDQARQDLVSTGVSLLPGPAVWAHLGTDATGWTRFARHWADLASDRYASARGTRRLRRYGRFRLAAATGELTPLPHRPFVQPQASNPLYVRVDRHFEPLTPACASDPVLHGLLRLLGRMATALDDVAVWEAQVHPSAWSRRPVTPGSPRPRDCTTTASPWCPRSWWTGATSAAGAARCWTPTAPSCWT
ncbi:hypothetical protein GCM10020295_75720 [Streptomyces cinereospinus]